MAEETVRRSVAVVIPSYQCAEYLPNTLDSVLAQTLPPTEVFVIDDGSTDDTPRLVKRYGSRIHYVRQANAGVAVARNHGLGLVKAPWVMFLDADDILEPQALEALLTEADGDVVVYGDKTTMVEDGTLLTRVVNRDCTGPAPSAARACFGGAAFEPGCAIVPRRLALELGGFDQRYAPCEDRHFWVRCGALVEFRHVGEPVMRYRVRPGSHSKNRTRQVYASVKTRLDLLEWFRSRHLAVFETQPEVEEVIGADLEAVYWGREWPVVDALLELATQYGIDSPRIHSVRKMRRIPPLIWTLKDALDRERAKLRSGPS